MFNLNVFINFPLIFISLDYPRITWVTPSPYEVVEEISDIIEIRTNTDNLIREIKWFFKGVAIINSMNYIFLGKIVM